VNTQATNTTTHDKHNRIQTVKT